MTLEKQMLLRIIQNQESEDLKKSVMAKSKFRLKHLWVAVVGVGLSGKPLQETLSLKLDNFKMTAYWDVLHSCYLGPNNKKTKQNKKTELKEGTFLFPFVTEIGFMTKAFTLQRVDQRKTSTARCLTPLLQQNIQCLIFCLIHLNENWRMTASIFWTTPVHLL